MKTVAFHTLGCKLNFAETSELSRRFSSMDYTIVGFRDTADVYVIHTCVVTGAAERKCIAAIRQARKRNPSAKVAVIGCMPELNSNRLIGEEGIDLLVGNREKFNLPQLIENPDVKEFTSEEDIFTPSYSSGNRTRTFFKVQDGCDYFCAYCTIPLARGRSRSDSVSETVARARDIVLSGTREIVLTGINLGDFGRKNGENLLQLLESLDEIEGLHRIRLSSIEPDLLSDDIIDFVASSNHLMPHFHIPLQSGSDKVLKLMKRRYNSDGFAGRVIKIKEALPDACIATDIITGFPGEDDDDFEKQLIFLKKTPLSYMHVFTYSERDATDALLMEHKVPHKVRKQRSEVLHAVSESMKTAFYLSNIGRIYNVLFESGFSKGSIFGFTNNYIRVKTKFSSELADRIVRVKLLELSDDGSCETEILDIIH